MKKFAIAAVVVLVVGLLAWPTLREKLAEYTVELPEMKRPAEMVKLEQQWTEAQREEFHFTAQGTALIPVAWFVALEQPCFSPLGCGLFSDPAYLSRFGFIPSAKSDRNEHALPIGFAVDRDFVNPADKRAEAVVGFTCAACHTGELFYNNKAILVEGAPAMVDVTAFQKAMVLALGFNVTFPLNIGRYGRFEKRVLGESASDTDKAELKARVEGFVKAGKHLLDVTKEKHIYDNSAGFARTDALTRIGNQVFAVDMGNDANFQVANAPVRFPQIWDASWFTWVQYNSSISDPLVRNIGEALGVRAAVQLTGENAGKFENSVNMRGLRTVEGLLKGSAPFQGLASPKWPSVFPPLDAAKVAAGALLYKTRCQACHLPSREELIADLPAAGAKNYAAKYWWGNRQGNWYLDVVDVDVDAVGTDPNQSDGFLKRTADTGALKMGTVSAAKGLDLVTQGIADRFYERENIPAEDRIAWASGRDPQDERVRAVAKYKARPLNGIWVAAPYLHNGSVPTLEALLSPEDRPATFWMGRKDFDPVKVGYSGAALEGGYLFDTSKPGNSNAGHRFKDGARVKGVIGAGLSAEERAAIVEYLKSL